MELKNIILYLFIGCVCIGFGIGKILIMRHLGDMGTIFNPKEVTFSFNEKIAVVASLIFLLFAFLLFIYGMYLWHY